MEIKELNDPGELDMLPILKQHRTQWRFRTSKGYVTLKYLGKDDHTRIVGQIMKDHPEYKEMGDRGRYLLMIKKANMQGDKTEINAELDKLNDYFKQFDHLFFIPCFVTPKIQTQEECDALMDSLGDDYYQLFQVLVKLTSSRPIDQVHSDLMTLCKGWGVQVSTDLTAENITINEADLLSQASLDQMKAIEEYRRSLGG